MTSEVWPHNSRIGRMFIGRETHKDIRPFSEEECRLLDEAFERGASSVSGADQRTVAYTANIEADKVIQQIRRKRNRPHHVRMATESRYVTWRMVRVAKHRAFLG